MRRSDFNYDLPPELVAQRPATRRAGSRLLRVGADAPTIGPFDSVLEAFSGDEVLVVNDTRVVPARVRGRKLTGGAVEVFVVEPLAGREVVALVRGKRLVPGTRMALPEATAELVARRGDGTVTLKLTLDSTDASAPTAVTDAVASTGAVATTDAVATSGASDIWAWLERVGEVPLPPYIDRAPDADDVSRYQTVFASHPGAVAAPTAGLHFTPELLDALRAKGVEVCTVTLHVGLGTFLPVRADDVAAHVMHAERFEVPPRTAAAVVSGRPVVAVGTTVVRALEAHALDADATRTDLFILPGFEFQVVDGLLTNFHLPESTLLMLVSAFAGRDRVLAAYRAAVAARMRFYSYGDAMLLRREGGRWTSASR